MKNKNKIIINEELFENILKCINASELNEILKNNNIYIDNIFDFKTKKITKIKFDENFVFNFSHLKLCNLNFNIDISGGHYFHNILIANNKTQNGFDRYIKLTSIGSNEIEVYNNDSIDLQIDKSTFTEFNFFNNKNARRISLIETEINNDFEIKDTELEFIYIQKSKLYNLSFEKSEINFEGIVIKETILNNLVIADCQKVYKLNFSEDCNINNLSITNTSINYINVDNSKLDYIYLFRVSDLYEFTIYYNSKIKSINNAFSAINRFLISDNSKVFDIIIQKATNVNLLRLTDDSNIHSITIKESNILSFVFYRGAKINYFESDDKSKLGDFDVLDSYIKALLLSHQSNSYNFKNTEIGLLNLDFCKISSLNILNGCKIEAYISNSEIDKIEFKKVQINKDSSVSFNSCKVFSIIMESFSVVGNLFFRNMQAMKNPLDEEWSNINKYFAKPNNSSDESAQQLYSTREIILNKIKKINNKIWIYNSSTDKNKLEKDLIEKNYFDSKINNVDSDYIIENIKNAHFLDREFYEKMLLEKIKNYTFHNIKKLKDFSEKERENLDFNFNILQFVWAVISKIKTYDLGFQNIDKPIFRVYQTSLGKTEFSNCALKDFEFQYNTTNFYDCIFLGTEIPEDNLNILDYDVNVIDYEKLDDKTKKDFYTQKSDFYNQFKKIFEKHGNVFSAGLYSSKWAENQEKLLLLKIGKEENYLHSKYDFFSFLKSIKLLFEKSDFDTIQNIFTFNLNRISNKHGESWSKSLIFIIVPLLISFFLYVLFTYYDFIWPSEFCEKNIQFSFDNEFWSIINYHIKDIPVFFNPARKLDFFEPISCKGYVGFWANLIDFISRIILAFGIYQLIVAFRKNAKKQ